MNVSNLLVAAILLALCQPASASGSIVSFNSLCPANASNYEPCEDGKGHCCRLGHSSETAAENQHLKCVPVPEVGATSYVFGFLAGGYGASTTAPLKIYLYSRTLTDVEISVPLSSYSVSVSVNGGAEVEIPFWLRTNFFTRIYPLGFSVTASNPIVVFTEDVEPEVMSGTAIHSPEYLGNEYILVSWFSSSFSSYAVVSPTDGNYVEIYFPTRLAASGILNGFELFYHWTRGEITGSYIISTQQLVVFAGSECVNVDGFPCDHIGEQIPAIDYLSRVYIISYPYDRLKFAVKVVGVYADTDVQVTGSSKETIDRTESLTYRFEGEAVYVIASKNVIVAAFALSTSTEPEAGTTHGPAMAVLAGIDLYTLEYGFFVPDHVLYATLMVIIPTQSATSFVLNGEAAEVVDSTKISVPGEGSYTVLYVHPPHGASTAASACAPFGAYLSFFRSKAESWYALPWQVAP